jgi:hypothetical protein
LQAEYDPILRTYLDNVRASESMVPNFFIRSDRPGSYQKVWNKYTIDRYLIEQRALSPSLTTRISRDRLAREISLANARYNDDIIVEARIREELRIQERVTAETLARYDAVTRRPHSSFGRTLENRWRNRG